MEPIACTRIDQPMLYEMSTMSAFARSAASGLADVARGLPARHAQVTLGYLGIYLPLEWVTHIHALKGIGVSLWNPSPAVAVALLLTRGFGYAPLLFVAALLASFVVHGGPLSLSGRLLSCATLTLGYTALAFVLRQQRVYDVLRGSLNDILRLLLLVPVCALAIAAVHSALLLLTGNLSVGQVVVATTHFWIGDTVGIITLRRDPLEDFSVGGVV